MTPNKPGWGYGAYQPPATEPARLGVVLWYRVYTLASAVAYALMFARMLNTERPNSEATPVIIGLGTIIALVFVAAAFIPMSPRGWTLGLVAIGLGMIGCLFPAAAILLVLWCRPVTKAAFRRV